MNPTATAVELVLAGEPARLSVSPICYELIRGAWVWASGVCCGWQHDKTESCRVRRFWLKA